jgi:hypothetical protein
MTYIAGDPWFCCDRCGFRRRVSVRHKEWTGLIVCAECLDPRPAQLDPPDIYPEGLPITDPRPEPTAVEVTTNQITRDSY